MTNKNITETELEEISDDTFTKISISWMLKKRETKKSDTSPPEEKNTEKTKENFTPKIKLSIKKTDEIQKENKEIEIIKEKPINKKNIENKTEDTLPKIKLSLKKDDLEKEIEINKKEPLKKEVELTIKEDIPKKTYTIKDVIPDKKENKVVLSSIKKEILTDKEKSNKEIIPWNEKLLTENNYILSNYKSDFSNKSESIIEKLKKLKNIPKTRIWLVVWGIVITIVAVTSVFTLNPEYHSLDKYKTNILWNEETVKNNNPKPNVIKEKESPPPIKEIVKWKPKTINSNWTNFSIQYKLFEGWKKIYKYKNKEYDSLDKLNMFLEKLPEVKKNTLKKINSKVSNFLLRNKHKNK